MPGWLKAVLVVAVLMGSLATALVVGGYVLWHRNKDKLFAKANQVASVGREFGRTTDNQGCVDEGIARHKKEPGFTGGLSSAIFLRSCLDTSRPTPGLCTDVPKTSEFMKTVEWRRAQCVRIGLASDSSCSQLFQGVQDFCERGPLPSPPGDPTPGP